MPVMLWCSASQNRWYPSCSTCRARSRVLRSASAAVPPATIGDRSSTEKGMLMAVKYTDAPKGPYGEPIHEIRAGRTQCFAGNALRDGGPDFGLGSRGGGGQCRPQAGG